MLAAAAFLNPAKAYAAKPVKITDCRMVSSKKLRVRAAASDLSKISGSKCYLFALSFSGSKIGASAKPVRSVKKAKNMTFTVSFKKANVNNMLYRRYVIAQKQASGKYKVISNYRYITNPGKSAAYTYKFPTASSKKGLQTNPEMREDYAELNIKHAAINIVFTEILASPNEQNQNVSYAYSYHGKTYWFRRYMIESLDTQLKALKQTNAVVTAIMLLGWRSDLTYLITPAGRQRGHEFYGWNTKEAQARETLQASLSFLAKRYASKSAPNGRIANWIIGNEVNDPDVYHYSGRLSLKQFAKEYAESFRMAYTAISSVYANARCYISLDHLWNSTQGTSFTARKTLDAFASAISREGYIPWNIAYHPYSSPLTEPKFWENWNQQLTASLTSPVINMGNLSLLTTYVKKTYGKNTRIILSEQGFTSRQNGRNTSAEQAAAIAYSYYLTEADDMVDSFMMNRQVDNTVANDMGLYLGLWTTAPGHTEWADAKKESWMVYKFMDTNLSKQYTSKYLKIIGAKNWKSLIKGFSSSLYTKTYFTKGTLSVVSQYQKKAAIPAKWNVYGAVSGKQAIDGGFRVYHDSSRNPNCLWGLTQNFSSLSFSAASELCMRVKITGASAGKAIVMVRVFSGNRIYEAQKTLPCNTTCKLKANLAAWEKASSVKRIQILASPVSGLWHSDAYMSVTGIERGA